MPQLYTHGECGRFWSGLRRQHCPACHETFNSTWAADKHRVGAFGVDRRCLDPQEAGLVAVEHEWGTCWQDSGTADPDAHR